MKNNTDQNIRQWITRDTYNALGVYTLLQAQQIFKSVPLDYLNWVWKKCHDKRHHQGCAIFSKNKDHVQTMMMMIICDKREMCDGFLIFLLNKKY